MRRLAFALMVLAGCGDATSEGCDWGPNGTDFGFCLASSQETLRAEGLDVKSNSPDQPGAISVKLGSDRWIGVYFGANVVFDGRAIPIANLQDSAAIRSGAAMRLTDTPVTTPITPPGPCPPRPPGPAGRGCGGSGGTTYSNWDAIAGSLACSLIPASSSNTPWDLVTCTLTGIRFDKPGTTEAAGWLRAAAPGSRLRP
jgi:hypothetical protein